MIELSKEETERARNWRIEKCGSIDFEDLKREFANQMKNKYEK